MIYKIGDSVITPLGMNTDENYCAVKEGQSSLLSYPAGTRHVPFPFCASLLDPYDLEMNASAYGGARTHLMSRLLMAIMLAFGQATNDMQPAVRQQLYSNPRVAFVFATMKGNAELLSQMDDFSLQPRLYSWFVAQEMMRELHLLGRPIILTNTPSAGEQGILIANRLLSVSSDYDYVIMVGAELQSDVHLTGLSSAGFASVERCIPYDIKRAGTNMGEAAACMIFASERMMRENPVLSSTRSAVCVANAYASCDGYDFRHQDPQAKSMIRSLSKIMEGISPKQVAFICSGAFGDHEYDEMEARAIHAVGLSHVPITNFKPNFGFCGSATGVMETAISCKMLKEHSFFPILGFSKLGVSSSVKVPVKADSFKNKPYVIKLGGGAGGLNVALLLEKKDLVTNK